jgi:hypothetical protein
MSAITQSPVTNIYEAHEMAHTAYYRADSGALVFDAGTIWWGWGLSESSPRGAAQSNALKGNTAIQQFTRNLIQEVLQAGDH